MMAGMSQLDGKTLVRPRDGRIIAGVCVGLGRYFNLDVTLVRLIAAVVAVFTGGVGVLAYLVAWVVVPEEGETSSIAENLVNKYQK
jgi:phage shock protein C